MLSLRRENIRLYLELMRINRPIGTYLVLWPAMWALFFAAGDWPSPKLVIIFVAGGFLMRSAGCVINDYADRDWDGEVSRTQDRPLASKRVTEREALQLFGLLLLLAACLLIFLDKQTRLWSVGAAGLASLYPFTKRLTHLPQVALGAAFAWSVPMAFVAQSGSVNDICWLLFFAVILWVVVYDTFYAMVDRRDDLKVGIKSTAILFGSADRKITASLQIIVLAMLSFAGYLAGFEQAYFLGITLAAALFSYQQYLIKDRDEGNCFKAFLNNHYVGMVITLGIVAEVALSGPIQ